MLFIKSVYQFVYKILRLLYHYLIVCDYKPIGFIYMLHRVDNWEEGKLYPNENMKVSSKSLEDFILKTKDRYNYIRCEEIPLYLKNKNPKPFIAFTMDDGYKDNYTNALRIFRKYNVPFTVFFAANFAQRKAVLWWYELEDLLQENKCIKLSNGITYLAESYKEKCDSFLRIREEILKIDQIHLIDELNKLFNNYNINWFEKCEKLCMSWDELQKLNSDPLVTIGAHTEHHYNLKQLNKVEDVKNEILSGVKLVKENTGISSDIIAYPFGSKKEVGQREFEVACELGFKCGFVAYGGAVTKRNKRNLYSLPRIMLTEDYIRNFK